MPASTPAETQEVALAAEQALGGDTLLSVYRETNNTPNFVHEIPITLPNETCENCTLQVIQFMFDTGQTFYFQCADLVIAEGGSGADAGSGGTGLAGSGGSGGAAGTAGSAAGAGGTAAAGAAGSPSAGAGGGVASSDDEDDGGCSLPASGSGTGRGALFAVAALGLSLLRRRR
ncbi:MAG: hypothetical protein ABI895_43190 [Deltaproteobacteria bacterium]